MFHVKAVRAIAGSTLTVLSLLAATSLASAADKITIMVGGYEKQIYLPAKLAEGLGYFKDEGLDVELLNEAAGVDAENQLLAGAVQGVVGFYDHCVDLQAKGKFVESVVQFSQAPAKSNSCRTSTPTSRALPISRARISA